MSLLGRIADLFQAKTLRLVTLLEKPGETLDLSYEKLMVGLQETKRHLADVTTERVAIDRQIAAAEADSVRAEEDARTALGAGREDLARAALRHKQAALQTIGSLRQARAALVPQIDRLVGYQTTLQERIDSFRTEKELLKSRYAAAQAQVRVTEAMTGLGTGLDGAGASLRRAKDRIEQTQDRADAMAGMLDQGLLADPLEARSEVDRELHDLRAGTAIDAELARMKAELGIAGGDAVLRIENRSPDPASR